jgi:hypothetical protein
LRGSIAFQQHAGWKYRDASGQILIEARRAAAECRRRGSERRRSEKAHKSFLLLSCTPDRRT